MSSKEGQSIGCTSCGAENRPGSTFCGSCGSSLAGERPCPRCGGANPPRQRFCNACGLELDDRAAADLPVEPAGRGDVTAEDPSGAGVDGERKQVTVLFADVKGSMEMAEEFGPERWREIMQRFFSIQADAVRRFEGTVDKFTGDGIMALFGAPIAHEDHAQRACYAALKMLDDTAAYATELRRRDGVSFSARIGINSGEVVAGPIGDGGGREYTAIGHTVGLAQRMEALAAPGSAYLTEHAAALAGGFLELNDLGEFAVKGTGRPIEVFELAGAGSARTRLDLSRERGFSHFVGRGEEMAILDAALERAEQGRGAVIGIVGEPGVGKSRLCHEFAERCRTRGIEVFEAQAQAHGKAIPFLPVLQMLRAYFGIEDRDPERRAREKIAGRMLLLDSSLGDDLPLMFDFLGVPDPDRPAPQISAEARQRALRAVIRRLVQAPNRREPAVNVIEDLHWMDEGSEAYLNELIGAVEGTRLLAIVNFRPEYSAGWTDSPAYRGIPLMPLGPDDTRELLRDLVGEDGSLDKLGELVHGRTAGNPFFVEEIVRELTEAGDLEGERGAYRLVRPVGEARVPASVQAILTARIDRLAPPAKRLLQLASVIGKEVAEPALRLVAGAVEGDGLDSPLRELIAAGFLYEAEIYPERVLAFRHPLTQEVAYGSQLGEQRRATHAATARAIAELHPDRHDELAALIAQHLEAGGETLEAARWSARAAHWAGYGNPRDAQRLWRRATELASQLEETEEVAALAVASRLAQLNYAIRVGMEAEEAESLAEEAAEIATRSGDLRSLALLRLLEATLPSAARNADTATALADAANRLADESGDRDLRVTLRSASAYGRIGAGRFDEAERMLDEALELAGEDHTVGGGILIDCPVAFASYWKAVLHRERCELERSEELLERALRIATEQDDAETASWTRGVKAQLLASRGDSEAAVALARRNCELTEPLGDVFSRTMALGNLSATLLANGDPGAALDAIERGDLLAQQGAASDSGTVEILRGALRARALLGVGRAAEALDHAETAVQTGRTSGLLWFLPLALRALACARAASGDMEAARQAFAEASEVAERMGSSLSLREIEADRAEVLGELRG